MPTSLNKRINEALRSAIDQPCLASARALEQCLSEEGFGKKVFGRVNQKSSIEAASESDRGIAERLANAFDASLSAALLSTGITQVDRTLTPRHCAQRFLCPNIESSDWIPQDERISLKKPVIQFWAEQENERRRFRKYNPGDGLVTVLVRDFGIGMGREEMSRTILDLNSDSKLKAFEAIGQFGHGGSSSLAFCESCLVISKPRFKESEDDFYWTLVFTEPFEEDLKQDLIRRWFCDADGLPLLGLLSEFQELSTVLPGTSIWHYGYNRGGWIKEIKGPEQSAPWGRLGRLLFSYPLPFEIHGEFARTDTTTQRRDIKGAFFRLLEKASDATKIQYRSSEKSETLIVDGQPYGQFSIFIFTLVEKSGVRDYVDLQHPVIMTLNGQNHGEMTRRILETANLPEIASSTIVEVRLDNLDNEAKGEIISNSREAPKHTAFTRALQERLLELLASDEVLQELERRRQEEKAKKSNADLNRKIARFLSSILSDAIGPSGRDLGGTTRGGGGGGGGGVREPLPDIPQQEPPHILEFLKEDTIYIHEGGTRLTKFKSDARPSKYSFHGDNPRCFASLDLNGPRANRLTIVGKADINTRGYGSVSLNCSEDTTEPITEKTLLGDLKLIIQCTDGRLLQTRLPVGISPKQEKREKRPKSEIYPNIIFVAPDGESLNELADLIGEEKITPFSECTYLEKCREALGIDQQESTYWGEKAELAEKSVLQMEINAANPKLKKLFERCRTAEERVEAKERYVRDVALDCYQHCFKVESIPEIISDHILTDPDDAKRAAEIYLNHDKALRIAINELEAGRRR